MGGKTTEELSLTEFRHQMHSGNKLGYFSLNSSSSSVVLDSRCDFVQIPTRN